LILTNETKKQVQCYIEEIDHTEIDVIGRTEIDMISIQVILMFNCESKFC